MEELVSYRAECLEANETIATFTQQHNLAANRYGTLQWITSAPIVEYSS